MLGTHWLRADPPLMSLHSSWGKRQEIIKQTKFTQIVMTAVKEKCTCAVRDKSCERRGWSGEITWRGYSSALNCNIFFFFTSVYVDSSRFHVCCNHPLVLWHMITGSTHKSGEHLDELSHKLLGTRRRHFLIKCFIVLKNKVALCTYTY